MKKAIIIILLLVISSISVLGLSREISSTEVGKGGTFEVRYNVDDETMPFFFSIKDVMSGGCTISGSDTIVTTLTSPAAFTEVTVTAPSSDAVCTFRGDSKLGSSPIQDFADMSITVSGEAVAAGGFAGTGSAIIIVAVLVAGFFIFKKK